MTKFQELFSEAEQIEIMRLDLQIMLCREEIEDYQKERRTILMRGYQRNHRHKQKALDTVAEAH